MKVGERYNGDRILTWFRNLPFTVWYTAGAGTVSVTADGQVLPSIILSDRKVYNLTLQGIDANRDVVLNLLELVREQVYSIIPLTLLFTH